MLFDDLVKIADGQRGQLVDVLSPEAHRQRLGTQARAVAGPALVLGAVALQLLGGRFRLGAVVIALQPRQQPFVTSLILRHLAAALELQRHAYVGAVQQDLSLRFRKFFVGGVEIQLHFFRQLLETVHHVLPAAERQQRPAAHGEVGIDRQIFGKMAVAAQPRAVGTGSHRVVEGEQRRLDVGQRDIAVGADEAFRQHVFRSVGGDDHKALAKLQSRLHGFGHAAFAVGLHRHAVDDHFDAVFFVLVQRDLFFQPEDFAVDAHAHEAFLAQRREDVLELALLGAHDRGEHFEPGAAVLAVNAVDDLVHGILVDGLAAPGAVRRAGAGEQQAQVVVDLGDGADGGAGIVGGPLLFDGNGGRQPFDVVHVGFFLHAKELTRVRRQRFHVAALAFGVERVERQRTFSRPRGAGDDDEFVLGDFQRDALEVMLSCVSYNDFLTRHGDRFLLLLRRTRLGESGLLPWPGSCRGSGRPFRTGAFPRPPT